MPTFPVGVETCQINYGKGISPTGNPQKAQLQVDLIIGGSAQAIVWAADGTPLLKLVDTFSSPAGEIGAATVPVVDQDGYVDGGLNAFKNWAYRLTERVGSVARVKYVQPLAGQGTIDFDLIPDGTVGLPVSAPVVPVTSVNGQTGAVVVDGASDATVNEIISDEASESYATLTAAIGAVAASDAANDASGLAAAIEARIAAALEDFDGGEPDYFRAAFALPSPSMVPVVTVVPYALAGGETLVREKRMSDDTSLGADLAGDTHFRYDGSMVYSPHASNPTLYVATPLLPGGTAQAARYQTRIQTITDSPVVKFRIRAGATSMRFRIKVGDAAAGVRGAQWVYQDLPTFTGLSAGQAYAITLTFPNSLDRYVEYESSGGEGFGGVAIASTSTLTRPPEPTTPLKVAFLGDSYTGGAGNPPDGAGRMEVWANWVAKLIGATSYINFGIGGTGYIASGEPFINRTAAILEFDPDIVFILGSRNDGNDPAIEAAAAAVYAALEDIPLVYVSGPSTAAYAVGNGYVEAATLAADRIFLDGLAEPWIDGSDLGTDGVHPLFEGHKKIARGLFEALQAVGKPTPPPGPPVPDVGDDFNRTDTASGIGVASIGGSTWGTAGAATRGIAGGQAYTYTASTAVGYSHLAAAATGTWDWELGAVGAAKSPKLDFNYVDGSNHFRVFGDGTHWALQRRTTAGGSVTVVTSSVLVADGDHVQVSRDLANLVTVKINGTTIYSATETANAGGGLFGFLGSSVNADTLYNYAAHTPLAA